MRLRAIAALSAVAVLAVPTAPARAAGNGEWAVTPTPAVKAGPTPRVYFFLDASAGQTVKESVRVANLGTKAKSFLIYGADAYNTARDGGFALRTSDEPQKDIGAWTRSAAARVTVPAGEQADIPFTITVPKNATPGDHVGGVVAMETEPGASTGTEGATVRIQRAVAARIYLRVAGVVVPGLAVRSVELDLDTPLLPAAAGGKLKYQIANVGNVHLVPTATVKTTGLFGHAVKATGSTPSGDFVPGADGTFTMRTTGAWPLDIVTASVVVRADGGVYAKRTDRAFVISWTALAIPVAAAAAVLWMLSGRRRSKRLRARVTE
ncbi:WxL protein peptidoglycan domain-containing protein [Actinoplanes sp. CA-142083]|uniref:WxL protein peptidoglycan domain-containing protein n=1 Tax=Actinoplanes sp. CA-142083 TaxID=3239903 RepID=UPI003D907074